MSSARIYIRKNGKFCASCDGCADTGHYLTEDSGKFTVYPVGAWGDEDPLVSGATRQQAEEAIAADWRRPE